jgi:hypothetical protein
MNVRIRHDLHFTAGIFYAGQLRMNNYRLRLWMATNCEDATDQNTAFERAKYFVYNEMANTIFINQALNEQCVLFSRAGLDITTLPADPVDQLIGIMLYYKLNAIMEDRVLILETELSSAYGENIVYLHAESENISDIVQPDWWQSADITHCDHNLIENEKIVALSQSSGWRDLDLGWTEANNNASQSGNTVVFADFKKTNETE